ncbi:MAG: condensation domain-containing protein [Myxococcota bacterium]
MTAGDVLRALARVGASARVDGGKLKVDAPKGAITAELAGQIREHKAEIIEALGEIGAKAVEGVTASADNRGTLSATQERIYAIDRLAPESALYNLAGVWCLEGNVDREALKHAVHDLLERHAMLRARFREGASGPVMTTDMPLKMPIEFRSMRGVEQSEILAWVERTAAEPHDLAANGAVRLIVIEYADERAFFFVASHGIIWDAWSYDLLLRDLGEFYAARVEGRAPGLEALTISYEDFAAWQKRQYASEEMEKRIQATLDHLAGSMERVPLPVDKSDSNQRSHAGARFNYALSDELSSEIREESRRSGATPFMVLVAGFTSLIARQSQVERLVVTIPVRNRNDRTLEGLIGPFTNNLFVPIDLTGRPGFGEMIARVRSAMLEGMSNQDVPFARVLDALGTRAPKTSLFQLDFSYQDTTERVADWGDLRILPGPPFGFHTTHAEIGWWVLAQSTGPFKGAVDFRTERFFGSTVRHFVTQFETLVAEGLADPGTPIWALPVDEAQLTPRDASHEPVVVTSLLDCHPDEAGAGRVVVATADPKLRRVAQRGASEVIVPDLMGGDLSTLAESIERARPDLVVADVPTAIALQSAYELREFPLTLVDAGAVTDQDTEHLLSTPVLAMSFDETDQPIALWRLGGSLVALPSGREIRLVSRWGTGALLESVGELASASAPLFPKQRVRVSADGTSRFLGAEFSRDRGIGAVESTLATHPAVAAAAVVYRGGLERGRLLGFFVSKDDAYVLPSELRAFLRERLPVGSVPGVLCELEAMPRTSLDEIDRSALPNPLELERIWKNPVPRSALERNIAQIWRELLGVETVGVYDNFFTLGGNSLLAVRAVARISEASGMRVEPRSLFFDSLSQLASSMESR